MAFVIRYKGKYVSNKDSYYRTDLTDDLDRARLWREKGHATNSLVQGKARWLKRDEAEILEVVLTLKND